MRKVIIALSLIFLAVATKAQLSEVVLKQIHQANQKMKKNLVGQVEDPVCKDCFPRLAQECRKVICESTKIIDSVQRDLDLAAQAKPDSTIENLLKELDGTPDTMEFSAEEKKKLLAGLDSFDGKIPKELQGYARTKVVKLWMKNRKIPVVNKNGEEKIDPSAFARTFSDLSAQQRAIIASFYEQMSQSEGAKLFWSSTPEYALSTEDGDYFGSIEGKMNLYEAQSKDSKRFFEVLGLRPSRVPNVIRQIRGKANKDKSDTLVGTLIFEISAEQDSEEFWGLSHNSEIAFETLELEKKLSSLDVKEKIRAQIEKPKADSLSQCQAAYRFNLSALPSQAEAAAVKALGKKMAGELGLQVGAKYSSQSAQRIQKSLKDTDIQVEVTREQFVQEFKEAISREIRSRKEAAQFRSKNLQPKLVVAMLAMDAAVEGDILSDISTGISANSGFNFCQRFDYENNSQAFPDAKPMKVKLGRDIQTHNPGAPGIIAHELGHLVDAVLQGDSVSSHSRKKKYSEEACLAEKIDPNDGVVTTSEDYADEVAALFSRLNVACNFPFGSSSSESNPLRDPFNGEGGGSHSSDFFRLLHVEQIQKGKLPDVCNQFLVENKTPTDFTSCLK